MVRQELKDRIPPHNEDAEKAALGAMLLDANAIPVVIQYVRPADFYSGAHSRICEVIFDLFDRNLTADILTVANELKQLGKLDEVGGAAYVASLNNVVPSSANIEYYAQQVQDYSLRRAMIRVSSHVTADSYDESKDARIVLEETEQHIFELSDTRQSFRLRSAKDILHDAFEDIERLHKSQKDITGIPTGIPELDRLTSGFQNQELIIIGARPSVGKTALALTMASHIAIEKKIPVAFFTLEMPDRALMLRILSAEARINAHALRTGFFKTSDFNKIFEAGDNINKAPLYIIDMPNMKLLDLRTQARRLRAQQKVEIIFIDYLGLITPENQSFRFQQRHEQMAEISRSLKNLARELKIPIVVLSQLTREAEKDRPSLASLRESGALEQDADVVIFLHREREAAKTPEEKKQEETMGKKTTLTLAKQRNGPIGDIDLVFESQYTTFKPFAGEQYENH
ncbi:replicative DNA helicase [Spirochaetia bacterium]|nr:replicative DNA helicase [Spirochaetia bacterium]